MIQTRAIQTAVKHKLFISLLQTPAGRQHGIGIILFHRVYLRALRHISQGIKVSQYFVGGKTQFLQMRQAAVGRKNIILLLKGLQQRFKAACAKNHKLRHKGLLKGFLLFYHSFSKRKRGVLQPTHPKNIYFVPKIRSPASPRPGMI